MRWGTAIIFLLGLALATGLVAWQGFAEVGGAIGSVGWGLLVLVAFRSLPTIGDGLAWRAVLGGDWKGGAWPLIVLRWVRDGVNNLLPVAQVGGDVVGARLLAFRGVGAGVAGGSLLVDKTLEILSQVGFVMVGVALLFWQGRSGGLVEAAVIGLLIMVPVAAAFVGAQWLGLGSLIERGLQWLARVVGFPGKDFSGINDVTLRYYRDRRRLATGFLLHFLVWMIDAVDIWLILWMMGAPVSLADAIVIESLSQIVRSAGFAVPATAGVQEVGYMVVGALVGVAPEIGLAVSLIKRLRHLAFGVPALLWWQGLEGRRWFAVLRRRGATRP